MHVHIQADLKVKKAASLKPIYLEKVSLIYFSWVYVYIWGFRFNNPFYELYKDMRQKKISKML